jgi:2-polyprenyl-3-methyl-5-hydroxy-6-metoxy-1,4-benzoquinol methylase
MDLDRLGSRYRGSTASSYENRRRNSEKWRREQNAVSSFVNRIVSEEDAPRFLDVPVGTGRFFDLYDENSVEAVGVDISEDMLEQAETKLADRSTRISLEVGDIMELADLDVDPDAVVCIRFMNWLDSTDVGDALASISETDPDHVIVGVRVRNSMKHRLGKLIRTTYHLMTGSGGSKTMIHDERLLLDQFTANGFDVYERELVDRWMFGDKYVYWLRSREQ